MKLFPAGASQSPVGNNKTEAPTRLPSAAHACPVGRACLPRKTAWSRVRSHLMPPAVTVLCSRWSYSRDLGRATSRDLGTENSRQGGIGLKGAARIRRLQFCCINHYAHTTPLSCAESGAACAQRFMQQLRLPASCIPSAQADVFPSPQADVLNSMTLHGKCCIPSPVSHRRRPSGSLSGGCRGLSALAKADQGPGVGLGI